MRTIKDLDRHAKQFLHPRVPGLDLLGGGSLLLDFGLPADAEQPPPLARVAAQHLRTIGEHAMSRDATLRSWVRTPSHQTISARWSNDGSRSRVNEIVSRLENPSDGCGGSSSR